MSARKSSGLRWLLAGAVVAGLVWLFFRSGAPSAPAEHPAPAAPGATRSPPATIGAAAAPAEGPAPSRWIDAVPALTAADRQARAERVRTRVTLARLQRHLAAAPVRPEDMSRLLHLLSYKLDLAYEFAQRAAASGLPASGPEYDRLFKAEAARVDTVIKDMVGESYFAEHLGGSFGRIDDRLYGWEFIGEALAQGAPLTSEQRWELHELQQRLDPHSARGKGEETPDPETGLTPYDAEVSRALARTLSAQQVRIFQQVRADWNLFNEEKRLRAAAGRK